MKMKPEQLSSHLKSALAPVYVINGEEVLLVNEAVDMIRTKARADGYDERLIFNIDRSFDWGAVIDALQTMSLFANKRWVELRIADGKPGELGASVIERHLQTAPGDIILMIICGKLDKSAQNAKWFKSAEQAGVSVTCYPISAHELPGWITARMRARGMQATPIAAKTLAERVEGNLLAAAQEIEKLALTHQGPVDDKAVIDAVADSARFDVFDLSDALLSGDSVRVVRMLTSLRDNGTEPALVLWACKREIRYLARLAATPAPQREGIFDELKIWQSRQGLYRKAVARLNTAQWLELLQAAARIDQAIKGAMTGNPWDLMIALAVRMSGKTLHASASSV